MNSHAASPLSHPHTTGSACLPGIPPARLTLAEALASATETKELCMGAGVIRRTSSVFRTQFPGHTAWVVADPTTFRLAGESIHRQLTEAKLTSLPPFVLEDPDLFAEHRFVEKIEAALRQHQAIPIAVGSGTINDLVKLAAHRADRPYLCVATAASMDGYTAFGASITYRGAKQTFNCPAPRAVIADTDLIRLAPAEMTASGYADLQAKITAGADWLLANALGIEPIDLRAWSIVQGGLRDALARPAEARAGDAAAISALTEGLMLGGFAMQWSKTSRPASGAEHQFSHLWDMEHHVHDGASPSHGFKVGLATLAIASLYEVLLEMPLEKLDVAGCSAHWPDRSTIEASVRTQFAGEDFVETAIAETAAKHPSAAELQEQLTRLKSVWPDLRPRLRAQLAPMTELKRRLDLVGAPTEPEAIGLTRSALRRAFHRAYFIRRRFTVLALA
ncbi:MAG TPA: sn-glycerol-1-phosphate dehydrogenase, partial [Lacunisphaera sp.]|nr:sn-glycerol-1-phosphate dehydrogenase [Lacunisphaera sp.]